MARAISSLPVPVSPKIRTVETVGATFSTCARTRRSGAEEPTISSNMEDRTMSSRNAMFSLRTLALFQSTGCAYCHTPTLYTGDSAIAALRKKPVHLHSDLLVHQMGPGLADDIIQ